MTNKQRLSVWIGTSIIIVTIAAGVCYLIWQAMLQVPANAARAWALLATVALPVATWAGWFFGHVEARGRLAGIDQAVDKVMGAATRAAGLRVETLRVARGTALREPPVVVLPDVEIVHRLLPRGGGVGDL